jgi:hypothetical protein
VSVRNRARPELRLELTGLGTVDPFGLRMVETPPGSGDFFVEDPARGGARTSLDRAGLCLAGAAQALLALSVQWMEGAGAERLGPGDPVPVGEVRLRLRRRDARLLASLLRRHLARLPEPPGWMGEMLLSLVEIDEFLRWTDGGLSPGAKNMGGP